MHKFPTAYADKDEDEQLVSVFASQVLSIDFVELNN
jgi:hypothetical protein